MGDFGIIDDSDEFAAVAVGISPGSIGIRRSDGVAADAVAAAPDGVSGGGALDDAAADASDESFATPVGCVGLIRYE